MSGGTSSSSPALASFRATKDARLALPPLAAVLPTGATSLSMLSLFPSASTADVVTIRGFRGASCPPSSKDAVDDEEEEQVLSTTIFDRLVLSEAAAAAARSCRERQGEEGEVEEKGNA